MAPTMSSMDTKKERWGDMAEEEDENDYTYLLPPKEVTGPDADGIKITVEYKFDELGQKVKVTTTSRVKIIKTLVSKRRSWVKFGDAVNDGDNGGGCTHVSTEDIKIDRPGDDKPEAKAKAKAEAAGQNDAGTLKRCKNCGLKGDHWTVFCPYKDLINPNPNPNPDPDPDPVFNSTTAAARGKYVPPNRAGRSDPKRRNEENSVRVTNLSEDTGEEDLRELFGVFGRLTRVYVATGRGFGFVNFERRDDAQKAILKLNGYGYDNLILRVEWAGPKANYN